MRRRITAALGLASLAVALVAATAPSASAGGPTLTLGSVTRSGGSATVSGTATFPALASPESVGGDDTDFTDAELANGAGIDLTDAQIVPLADGSGLRFIWKLNAMPDQTPPEVVRYTWSFAIGTTQFQLQAKRTNMASTTTLEDPVNHVKQLASAQPFFQLRGACQASYQGTPVSGCYHLAFLKGSFDPANKTVSMDLPYNTRDQIGRLVASEFHPGVQLLENETAGMSITAAFQAVIGNTSTSDYVNGWSTYFVGPQVALAVGPAGALDDPTQLKFGPNLTLGSNGSFSGTVSGLDATNTTVYVRACNGETCAYASA